MCEEGKNMRKKSRVLVVWILLAWSMVFLGASFAETFDFKKYQESLKDREFSEDMGKNFCRVVLDEVEKANPEIEETLRNHPALFGRKVIIAGTSPQWVIFHRREEFGTQTAEFLLKDGLSPYQIESIMEKAALYYGLLLAEMIRGRSAVSSFDEYAYELKALLAKENVSPAVQSEVTFLAEKHFGELEGFLKEAHRQ